MGNSVSIRKKSELRDLLADQSMHYSETLPQLQRTYEAIKATIHDGSVTISKDGLIYQVSILFP
jgi:hypothetical protein